MEDTKLLNTEDTCSRLSILDRNKVWPMEQDEHNIDRCHQLHYRHRRGDNDHSVKAGGMVCAI